MNCLQLLQFAFCVFSISLTAKAVPEFLKVSQRFDYGWIESMSNPANTLVIANSDDTPLEIHRVRACCGAKASVSTNSSVPGESATLSASARRGFLATATT